MSVYSKCSQMVFEKYLYEIRDGMSKDNKPRVKYAELAYEFLLGM